MAKRYSYAKASLPTDWAEKTASDIKIEIKNYMLDSVLRHRKELVIWEHIENILSDFCEEFEEEERELSEEYRSELYDFARDAYSRVKGAVGNLPTPLFVAALASPDTVTAQRKAEIGKYAMLDLRYRSEVIQESSGNPTGREIQDANEIAYTRATPGDTYYREVHKQTKAFLNDWLEFSKSKDYSSRVNPRNIAEMNVRFKKYQDDKAALIAKGVRLVYVPPHSNCSARCQPYQGRVYSLDNSDGTIDGRPYIPIEKVSDEVTYTSPKTNKTYAAGLFSYNCRHTMKEYWLGQNIEVISQNEIDRQRKIEEKQRRMERKIRLFKEQEQYYRTLNRACPNADILKTAQEARKKARELNQRYEAYSRENGVPFYRERTRIMAGEDIYARTRGKPVVTKKI